MSAARAPRRAGPSVRREERRDSVFRALTGATALVVAVGLGCVVVAVLSAVASRPTLTGAALAGLSQRALGTALSALGGVALASMLALGAAAFVSEASSPATRERARRLVGGAAAVPGVVYGLLLSDGARAAGLDAARPVALYGVLAAALALVVLPTLVLGFVDALCLVPVRLREAATALGATRWEAFRDVVLPATAPALVGAAFVALARAAGEAVVVAMVLTATHAASAHGTLAEGALRSWLERRAGGSSATALAVLAVMLLALGLHYGGRRLIHRTRARVGDGDAP